MTTACRQVQPEWLDELSADDPHAIRSRRDLARINICMRQRHIMARALSSGGRSSPRTIVDLGAGDGTFMLGVAALLAPQWPDVTIVLVDRRSIVKQTTCDEFAALGWAVRTVAADLFEFLKDGHPAQPDIMTANLFLHHFSEQQLARVLEHAASMTGLFVACEPRRAAFAYWASRFLWVLGCNGVTRHDAAISVQAGFAGRELSALWPEKECWELHEYAAWPFTHCLIARRAV